MFFFRSWIHLPSQFCVCHSHKPHKLAQGKVAVGQEKNGILKCNLSGEPVSAFGFSCIEDFSCFRQ